MAQVVEHLPRKHEALSSKPILNNTHTLAGHWLLTPVILVTQEADIKRTMVQSQPQEIVHKILF
jgi:hypothetical protein